MSVNPPGPRRRWRTAAIIAAMSPASPNPNRPQRRWIWKRADQAALAVLNAAALLVIAGYWFWQGGHAGRMIEIDQAPRRTVRFEVDINSAPWPELVQLPDIGETLARRIVESREQDGPYTSLDDLQRVRGIGPRTVAKLRPYLRPIPNAEDVAKR